MIHERNSQDQARVENLRGEHTIRLTREDVTTWVIVSDERPGRGLTQQGAEDISRADVHPVHLTERRNVTAANAVARIESEDVHGLLLGLSELRLQQSSHVRCRQHLMAKERLSDECSPAKLQRGLQLRCPRWPHPGLALQIAQADAQKSGRSPHHVEDIARQPQRPARTEHEGEELIIIELSGPQKAQALARSSVQRTLGKQRGQLDGGWAGVKFRERIVDRATHLDQAFF